MVVCLNQWMSSHLPGGGDHDDISYHYADHTIIPIDQSNSLKQNSTHDHIITEDVTLNKNDNESQKTPFDDDEEDAESTKSDIKSIKSTSSFDHINPENDDEIDQTQDNKSEDQKIIEEEKPQSQQGSSESSTSHSAEIKVKDVSDTESSTSTQRDKDLDNLLKVDK